VLGLDGGAVLVGERHRERRTGEQTRADEDRSEALARSLLLGECGRELLLGEETFQHEHLAQERSLVGRIHIEPIGAIDDRL
jgi:hypothetical protein